MKSPVESKTEEEWKSFIRQTCHDVRTPLTTLQGYSELTLKKPSNDIARKVSLNALRSVFEVELFLSLLSWRQKKMNFSFEEVTAETVFIDAISWVTPHVANLEFDQPETSHLCVLDKKKTQQALIALFLEFLQESGAADRIQIRVRTNGTKVCLSFWSSGTLLHAGNYESKDVSYRVLFAQQVLYPHRATITWDTSSVEVCLPIIIRK